MTHQILHHRWNELCKNFTNEDNVMESIFNSITMHYSEPARVYHTLDHVAHLVHLVESQAQGIENKDMLLFTAFFHDVIYIPGSGTNERESADFAVTALKRLNVHEHLILNTAKLVMLTQSHHQVDSSVTSDMLLFLDMDLCVFGAMPDDYEKYCKALRREFSSFPDFIFKKGRRAFLKSMLTLPFIFHTPYFQNVYEIQARKNIIHELKQVYE